MCGAATLPSPPYVGRPPTMTASLISPRLASLDLTGHEGRTGQPAPPRAHL
jgi:hypothetical protein